MNIQNKQVGLQAADVKAAMAISGRGAEALRDVAGLLAEVLDGRHHPCPNCGGTDRFRLLDGRTGEVFCNQGCWDGKKRADVLTVVQTFRGVPFREALGLVADYMACGVVLPVAAKTFPEAKTTPPKPKVTAKRKIVRVTHYDYLTVEGERHLRATRYDFDDGNKIVPPYHWDAESRRYEKGIGGLARIPFNAAEVQRAESLFFVEGEKCAVVLKNHLQATGRLTPGLAVTCIIGGSNGWKPELAAWFAGKAVVIIPDHDVPGYNLAWQVQDAVESVGGSAEVLVWPDGTEKGYDIADAIADGRWV